MKRYIDTLTSAEIAELDKQSGVVILPIGATEQHGAHLPIMTDTRQVTAVLETAFKLLDKTTQTQAWALPALPYSKSNEHHAFAGTISLSAKTLSAVLHEIANSISLAGFKRLTFLNGHGGNVGLLDSVARDIHKETGLQCFVIQPGYWLQAPFGITNDEKHFGIHAGELETSLMLKLEPSLVKMDKAVRHFPDFPMSDLHFFGAASVAWLSHEWSPSGVFGDATLGTAEKGEQLLDNAAKRLANLLTALSTFEIKHA